MVSVHRDAKTQTPDKLQQIYMIVPLERKMDTLFSFLRSHSQKKMIVFVSTCKQVRFIYEAFRKLKPGPAMMELHGRQSLTKRLVVFQEFTEKERAAALVCTDIAARGVDFPAVDWVVQVDCPDAIDSYIHRVGRTARYQASGRSALFLLPSETKFAEQLEKANVTVKNITPKQSKLTSIQTQLGSLLAAEPDIRHLAKRSFVSYLRSIHLMRDKDVFDASGLPKEEFANSLGLLEMPSLGADLQGVEDPDANPMKKKKNQSALQRLKERIQQKKLRKAGKAAGEGDDENGNSEEDEEEQDREGGGKKKLGKWERRQRRIENAKAGMKAELGDDGQEEDDLLQPISEMSQVADSSAAVAQAEVQAASTRKKKLKLRKDGSAVGAAGKHTFFDGKGEQGSELAQLAEDLNGGKRKSRESEATDSRASFLQRVSRDLASRDSSDAAVSRARIQETHKKRRRKEKEARAAGANSDDEMGVTLGGSGDESDDEPQRGDSPGRSSSDSSPRMFPGIPNLGGRPQPASAESKPRGKTQTKKVAPAPAKAKEVTGPPVNIPGDDLADLEKLALSRLSAGLFG
eukprot:TRINITY_DN39185_c0_g1_i1.p1 TRINITY_DN39185_c0_g1~~TRINITY_DN39185_c0_g1_i1.p1  ORF type:complete len:670 (+),score=172.35 TRINITY_DN39185_c0_g1_i1:286-2010(+)